MICSRNLRNRQRYNRVVNQEPGVHLRNRSTNSLFRGGVWVFSSTIFKPSPPKRSWGGGGEGGTVYAYSCPVCNFFLHCHWHIKIWHIDSLSWDNVSSTFMILVWPTFLPQSQIYIFLTLIHVQNHYIFCLLWHIQIIFGKYVYRIVTMCRVHSRYQYDIDLWPRG